MPPAQVRPLSQSSLRLAEFPLRLPRRSLGEAGALGIRHSYFNTPCLSPIFVRGASVFFPKNIRKICFTPRAKSCIVAYKLGQTVALDDQGSSPFLPSPISHNLTLNTL